MKFQRQTTEEFIAKAKGVWGEEYDYSRVVYRGPGRPITIICKVHGEFKQLPYNHLTGHRCHQCKVMGQTMSQAEFLERARAIFPKYDYSQVVYRLAAIKVRVVCPDHGPFERRPCDLLRGRGCRKCKDWRKARPKRGPQFKGWRPVEIEALRECLAERRGRIVNSELSMANC